MEFLKQNWKPFAIRLALQLVAIGVGICVYDLGTLTRRTDNVEKLNADIDSLTNDILKQRLRTDSFTVELSNQKAIYFKLAKDFNATVKVYERKIETNQIAIDDAHSKIIDIDSAFNKVSVEDFDSLINSYIY